MGNLAISNDLFNELYLYIGMLIFSILLWVVFINNEKLRGWAVIGFFLFLVSLFFIYKSIVLIYYSEKVVGTTTGIINPGYKSLGSLKYKYEYNRSTKIGQSKLPSNIKSINTNGGKYVVYVFDGLFHFSWIDLSKPIEINE